MAGTSRLLRAAGLSAVAIGVVGSTLLLLRSGPNAPLFLKILFSLWVISPFALLAVADLMSRHWSASARTTLYGLMLAMTTLSLVLYRFDDVLRPRNAPNAFMFVAVPPASWLVMAAVLAITASMSRGRS